MKKYIFPVVFYKDTETQKYVAAFDGIELFCDGKTLEETYSVIEEMLSDFVKLSIKVGGQVKEQPQDYLESARKHPGNVVMLLSIKVKNIESSTGDKKVVEAETIEGGLPERTWKIYQLENGNIEDIIIRAKGFDNNAITWMKNVIERESIKEAKALGNYIPPKETKPVPAAQVAKAAPKPAPAPAQAPTPVPMAQPEPEEEEQEPEEEEIEEEPTTEQPHQAEVEQEQETEEETAEKTEEVAETQNKDDSDDEDEPPKVDTSYKGQGRGAVGGFIGDFSKLTGEDIPDIRK
ncbi:MAG: hypothetical protein LBN07_04335 [Christensenellaceae bacterium]|jgi:hypothetical protein|nr:hypothetical protein [Christensenellaceae bacterium]